MLNILNILSFTTETTGCEMDTSSWIMMGVLGVLLIGFMVFSSFRRKKTNAATEQMKNSMRIGDKVQTIGGIIGIVTEINNAEGTITISTGTSTMVFARQAVFAFGFYDPPKPAPEQRPVESKSEETTSEIQSDNMDTINADFLDAGVIQPESEKKSKPKKSKKSAGDTARFE